MATSVVIAGDSSAGLRALSLLMVAVVLAGCIGDRGLQLMLLNQRGETVVVRERNSGQAVKIPGGGTEWMLICTQPFTNCDADFRVESEGGGALYCRKYAYQELRRTGETQRVLITHEHTGGCS